MVLHFVGRCWSHLCHVMTYLDMRSLCHFLCGARIFLVTVTEGDTVSEGVVYTANNIATAKSVKLSTRMFLKLSKDRGE